MSRPELLCFLSKQLALNLKEVGPKGPKPDDFSNKEHVSEAKTVATAVDMSLALFVFPAVLLFDSGTKAGSSTDSTV